jgi:hypothetical protein
MSSLPVDSDSFPSAAALYKHPMYNSSMKCVTPADPYTRPADMPLFAFLTFLTVPSRIPSKPYKLHCPDCAVGFYEQVVNAASLLMSDTFARFTFQVNPRFTCYTQDEFEEAIRRATASIAATR